MPSIGYSRASCYTSLGLFVISSQAIVYLSAIKLSFLWNCSQARWFQEERKRCCSHFARVLASQVWLWCLLMITIPIPDVDNNLLVQVSLPLLIAIFLFVYKRSKMGNWNAPHWWTPDEENALAQVWCGTSKDECCGGMKKGAYWEVVLKKLCTILKKKLYRNTDMLSSKYTQISSRCTKFNCIYHRLEAQQQSGTNDFDLFKATKEQYRVELGHVFKFENAWELV
uniref:Myb-like domain-containing protein n=1 Tax=Lactuca sativa TaxID=4236 RepID=A0A9R1V0C7_LACSA|nr:hypothetical protein LSAT_V11C700349220 [Lactuca sativa]